MAALSLFLSARVNRTMNVTVAALYAVSIVIGCIGETWLYYLLGSAVEIVLLGVIIWTSLHRPSLRR